MSRLARPSLAAFVCPSAPFLAPRLLRTPAFLLSPALQQRTYSKARYPKEGPRKARDNYNARGKKKDKTERSASKSWSEKRIAKARAEEEFRQDQLSLIERMHEACEARDVVRIMELYPHMLDTPLVVRDDTRRIAQALQNYLRLYKHSPEAGDRLRRLNPFLDTFVRDLKVKRLPSHPFAFVHLLGIYKETKQYEQGDALWRWLVHQPHNVLDSTVYGAAIELLAYGGEHTLEQLEQLYQDGLKRFPGTFAEYHLSPEAVLPDRTQPTSIPGLPMGLLQGIIVARVLKQDWKNAYLALDTALRLYVGPTNPPSRFFQIFMEKRPLSEAYTIFLMACRAGVVLNPAILTQILTRLRNPMAKMSLADRTVMLRAMANALYAYVEAGGSLEGPHASVFFTTMSKNMIPAKSAAPACTDDEVKIRNALATCAHRNASLLIQAGFPAQMPILISLVDFAGRHGVRGLFDVTLQDMETAGAKLGPVNRRVLLRTVSEFGDLKAIERTWTELVEKAEQSGSQLDLQDWLALAFACRRADHKEYFHQQLKMLEHTISFETEQNVLAKLEEAHVEPSIKFTSMEPTAFDSQLDEVNAIMKNVAAVLMAGQPLDLNKSPFYMHIDPHRRPLAPEDELRKIYDEFTLDPRQPPLAPEQRAPTPLSSTSIPLDELRFMNWCTINELLKDAEANQRLIDRRLRKAVAAGRSDSFQGERLLAGDVRLPHEDDGTPAAALIRRLRSPRKESPTTPRLWRKPNRQTRTVTSEDKDGANMKPISKAPSSAPTLRYYIAMESHHVAPANGAQSGSYVWMARPRKQEHLKHESGEDEASRWTTFDLKDGKPFRRPVAFIRNGEREHETCQV